MTIELRSVTEKNFVEWRKAVRQGFGIHVHPEDITRLRNDRAELDRLVAAIDTGSERIVGTGGADSYSLTVPGGAVIPMAERWQYQRTNGQNWTMRSPSSRRAIFPNR